MLRLLSAFARLAHFLIALPYRAANFLFITLLFNPRLGRMRFIVAPVVLYVLFALTLTYIYAPIRGFTGQMWMGKVLAYADERSLGTAIYDGKDRFIGIFDPILDSEGDFNYTGKPIQLPNYIAYPDHKSLHVGAVPQDYWQCLRYQEDRHLGGIINPFGIDLYGVLKIPFSTVSRTLAQGSPSLGVGGSTLSMQLARIFFKSPPRSDESAVEKLSRKAKEWWLAPVIHWQLMHGGDERQMQLWASNHFPLAQRTGGQELYGVEQTSLILYGRPAAAMSRAEQYALAAAVNQPVILIAESEMMQARRDASWKRVAGHRAKICANALIKDRGERSEVIAELDRLAATPPEPQLLADMDEALSGLNARTQNRAEANPVARANALLPSVKYGVREEVKTRFGYDWRRDAGAVHLTLDAAANLRFREAEKAVLKQIDKRHRDRINAAYTLDLDQAYGPPVAGAGQRRTPDIIIAAADANGKLVRYFESNFNAAYFGSAAARGRKTGRYDASAEARAIASTGKILAAVAIANEGKDNIGSQWLDTKAPAAGLEACGKGTLRRMRSAKISFGCSLNAPLEWRLSQVPVRDMRHLIEGFGITLADPITSGPNLAKSIVVGQVAASPRTVHRMAGTVLAALSGDPDAAVTLPTLVAGVGGKDKAAAEGGIIPSSLVKTESRQALAGFLSAPLCDPHGTLKRLSDWCAERRDGVQLHFAKTGTRGTGVLEAEADDTVDLWVAGGIKFDAGPAYSYVIVVGTGSPAHPWARDLYAGQVAEPLLRVLLEDLEDAAAAKDVTAR